VNKVNYKQTAFVLIKPPSKIISYHLIKSEAKHKDLINKAIEAGYCLYNAPITKTNSKYVATQPWYLDEETIPNIEAVKVVEETPITDKPDGLYCPFCDKSVSSTAGRTLHVKSNHPDKIEEYQKWLKSLGKKSKK